VKVEKILCSVTHLPKSLCFDVFSAGTQDSQGIDNAPLMGDPSEATEEDSNSSTFQEDPESGTTHSRGVIAYEQGGTVFYQYPTAYPQGATAYPQGAAAYPQGVMAYPRGAIMYPQVAIGYPQGIPAARWIPATTGGVGAPWFPHPGLRYYYTSTLKYLAVLQL
jgi:hypothetical protein